MFLLRKNFGVLLGLCKTRQKNHTFATVDTNCIKRLCLLTNLHNIKLNVNKIMQRSLTTDADNAESMTVNSNSAVVDLETISRGDPELLHKFKVLQLELEVMRQDGHNVPSEKFMKTEQWQELLQLPTRSKRIKYLTFLFKVEKRKENRQRKREEKRKEYEESFSERQETKENGYGLTGNSIFLRIYDTTMNQLYNNKLIQAMQFGQKLVIDCGYDRDMIKRENINCAKQVTLLFAENRIHKDPFDVHLCNVNNDSDFMRALENFIGTIHEPWFPLNIHKSTYLDIFPKEQLIYLTPHCKEEMITYDHDAIYIIGGLVDKHNNQPLSLAKAKKEGLRMLKFPLDKYLHWASGSGKCLTLNHCINILLDMKVTGDWTYSLRHIPRRKIVVPDGRDIAPNIMRAVDNLRYDRINRRERKKWTPVDLSIKKSV